MFNAHDADIKIVKAAVEKEGIVFRFIIKGGAEIGALVPDVFPRNRCVG